MVGSQTAEVMEEATDSGGGAAIVLAFSAGPWIVFILRRVGTIWFCHFSRTTWPSSVIGIFILRT